MFPNKYAKWRLVEIKAFIDTYAADIFVSKRIDSYSGQLFNFDYEELYDKFNLNQYNILIFNPKYNYINKFNKEFDGTKFNNTLRGDYMFRHKSKSIEIDISSYSLVYHIFLNCYKDFNTAFAYPFDKQIIHLYPGGGYLGLSNLNNIDSSVRLVTSQSYISKHISTHTFNSVYGGPFFDKGDQIIYKEIKDKPLTVCFTSMGDPQEKGAFTYLELVQLYKITYPSDTTMFISIGNCPQSEHITHYKPMDQNSLNEFYKEKVDVLINLDSGKALNGFPLGVEGAIQGCILFTTDVHKQNEENGFNIDPFHIIHQSNLPDIITKIRCLCDISVRQDRSRQMQQKMFDLFNYESTMGKIFKFIET
jgi:hypothetical protein